MPKPRTSTKLLAIFSCWNWRRQSLRSFVLGQFNLVRLGLFNNRRRLVKIEAQLKWLVTRSIQPGPLTLIGDTDTMADRITFNVALPAPPEGPNDIVSGELSVKIDGELVSTTNVTLDDTEVGPFDGPQDSIVDLEYRYVDDAGNKSEPSTAQFTLVDTVPPPAPGSLGVAITGEIHEEDDEPVEPTPSESGSDDDSGSSSASA